MGGPIADFQAALKAQREQDKTQNQQGMNELQKEQERQKLLTLMGKVRKNQKDNDQNPDVPFNLDDSVEGEITENDIGRYDAINVPIPQVPEYDDNVIPFRPEPLTEGPGPITDEQFEEAINVPIQGLPRIGESDVEIPFRPVPESEPILTEDTEIESEAQKAPFKLDKSSPESMQRITDIVSQIKAERGEPTDYDEAKKTRNITQALAQMVEGVEKAGAAYAGQGLTTIKPTKGSGDALRLIGKQAMSDVKEDEKMTQLDPNSQISQTYQRIVKSKFGKLLKDIDVDAMNASELKLLMTKMGQFGKEKSDIEVLKMLADIEYKKQRGRLAGEKADIVKSKFVYKQEEDRESDRLRYTNALKKHDAWKDGTNVKIGMADVDSLLEDAHKLGGVSLTALGIKMAKALGEKGVMTDKDVTRYIQDPSAYHGSQAWLKKLSTGQLTDKVYKDLKRVVKTFDRNADKKIQMAENKIITEYISSREGKESGMSIDDAKNYLGLNVSKELQQEMKQRSIVKIQRSPSRQGKERVLYSDGTSEVRDVK